MNGAIKTKTLKNVLIQENGIIRDDRGLLIGRLVNDIEFENLESRPVDGGVINFLPEAVKVITKALKEDEGFYQSYQANIAIQFQDEFKRQMGQIGRNEAIANIHQVSNNAAKNFLDLWCKD